MLSSSFYWRTFVGDDFQFNQVENRLKSFKDWPYTAEDDSPCTADKMAAAGFYLVGGESEPDLVRCFWCRRELDGWEPTDDPMAEHARRPCPFVLIAQKKKTLTLEDAFKLDGERQKSLEKKLLQHFIDAEAENVANVRKTLEEKVNGGNGSGNKAKSTRRKKKKKY